MQPKILVVEDDVLTRGAIEFILMENGFSKVVFANNGRDGLEKVESQSPDVVILDVILPDMKGYEICKKIKAMDGQSPTIVLMTGQFDKNDAFAAKEAAPDYFLAKTGKYDALLKILAKFKE